MHILSMQVYCFMKYTISLLPQKEVLHRPHIPRQGQVGWAFQQPGILESVPEHGEGLELGHL